MCVCVCVCERERERERQTDRQREVQQLYQILNNEQQAMDSWFHTSP